MRTMLEQQIFYVDALARTTGACIVFFAVLTLLYSWKAMPKNGGRLGYNLYLLLSLATALGAVLTGHLVVLLVCWGLTGIFLYILIGYGTKERTPATAKKAFIIIGGTDAFMMLGVVLIGQITGSFNMAHIHLSLAEPAALLAFLCLLAGVLAKAGVLPFHTWVPDTAEDAPTPVTAFLPAAVDKLLGIYLLARMVLDLFVMTPGMNAVLLALGAVTIAVAGVMMLMQQDFKRLLAFCAISQAGYVLLGIGTGHPLGIAGGLFHMVNHAIYKSCLFFSGGAVEQRVRTTDMERMGGLARPMPVIFTCFLIGALAVSGVPPLNGFVSKWMVYQGIIEAGREGGGLWVLWLAVAMFGSALTLAGMMKTVHAIFLGQPSHDRPADTGPHESTPWPMSFPPLLLASLSILFGIGAYDLPLKYLIFPILEQAPTFPGIWQPTLATVLILIAIGGGMMFYFLYRWSKTLRQTDVFIGGETLDAVPGMRVSGSAFYDSVQELPGFRSFFALAGRSDPYELAARIVTRLGGPLRDLHNGILSTYLSWCLLGMGVLFAVLLLR